MGNKTRLLLGTYKKMAFVDRVVTDSKLSDIGNTSNSEKLTVTEVRWFTAEVPRYHFTKALTQNVKLRNHFLS